MSMDSNPRVYFPKDTFLINIGWNFKPVLWGCPTWVHEEEEGGFRLPAHGVGSHFWAVARAALQSPAGTRVMQTFLPGKENISEKEKKKKRGTFKTEHPWKPLGCSTPKGSPILWCPARHKEKGEKPRLAEQSSSRSATEKALAGG